MSLTRGKVEGICGDHLIDSHKCFDLQLESNVEEQPRPRTASGNQPSQNLDPGILLMIRQ